MRRRISVAAHLVHGFFAGLLSVDLFLVSLFLFVQFLAYEFFEETKVKDELYRELKEWAAGYSAGLALLVLARVFGFARS